MRGILDGHIVLSRKLANENHFPAIDVNASISRLMSNIVDEEHKAAASALRDILSIYAKNEDLISIGAYKAGSNPKLDFAISKIDQVNAFNAESGRAFYKRRNFGNDEADFSIKRVLIRHEKVFFLVKYSVEL